MIKTMLLTAQLALSPIVGTKGLQPKRLPNPVYGESVNYSITYNGETYTRLAYVNEQSNWHLFYNFNAEGEGLLGINKKGLNNSGPTFLTTNMGSGGETDGTISLIFEPQNTNIDEITTEEGENVCVSFFAEDTDGATYYYEIFYSHQKGTNILIYEDNGTFFSLGESIQDSNLGHALTTMTSEPFETKPSEVRGRNIPQKQPTTANPSIYDNIYNFYYQNLFANEALDELGAEVGKNSLTMRQWLAHTATIFSISLLSAALVILVIKIFKLIAGSISDIWG